MNAVMKSGEHEHIYLFASFFYRRGNSNRMNVIPFSKRRRKLVRYRGVIEVMYLNRGEDDAVRIEYMQEFIQFSKTLNITQTAQELFTTQSTLSKHLRQMEQELGTQLVISEAKKIRLTPAGSLFATKARIIVNLYKETVRACAELGKQESLIVKAQYVSYQDRSAMRYLGFTQELKKIGQGVTIKYARASHRDFVEAVKKGSIDLALQYHCGNIEKTLETYREQGIRAKLIGSDSLGVWCSKSLLPSVEAIDVSNLASIVFRMPSDTSSPVYAIMGDLERLFGFTANVHLAGTDSQLEFIYSHDSETAYLWPFSFLSNELFKGEAEMVALPVAGTENLVHAYVISLENHPDERKEALLAAAFSASATCS